MIDRLKLSGDKWNLRQISRQEFFSRPDQLNHILKDKREIFPAKVPGNVRLDLLAAGRIPEPFFGKDNEKSKWVSDGCWMYDTKFEIPISFKEKDLFINFKRTDYAARFFLNGHYLGYNIGMFSPSIFKINDFINAKSEEQELVVLLKGSPKLRNRALKCQMAYGWDFAPNIRTIGIWDDVNLLLTDGGRITNHFVHYIIPKIESQLGKDVELIIEMELEIFIPINQVKIQVVVPDLDIIQHFNEKVKKGKNHLILSIKIDEVELWYPNSAGEQRLYELNFSVLEQESNKVIDKIENLKIGFRTLRMAYNPKTPRGNEKWTFVVNNRPEFIRGANWVPPDSFFGRIDEKRYSSLVLLAKDVNMNMFRLWGGGICEKDIFYDLCDQHGIMLWQEFPFACSNYPNHPSFLKLANKECTSYIKQVRNHPSVVAYMGGNEWNPRFNDHLTQVLRKCCELDPTRIFYDVSPCKGDLHDWAVWHMFQDFGAYKVGHKKNINKYQFFSEFGLQSCPNKETFEEMMPKSKIWPVSDHWKYHHAGMMKLERYGKCVCALKDLRSYIYGTQVAQAEGLKVGIEHVRKMSPEMSGVLFWQWNEPWPTICWSVIDYYQRPKIAYKYLKEIFNPILPIIEYKLINKNNSVIFNAHAANDLHETMHDCRLKVDFILNGYILETYSKDFDLIKERSVKVNNNVIQWDLKSELTIPKKAALNIKAKIFDNQGQILSENNYFPFRYRETLTTKKLHEAFAWLTEAFNEKFFWLDELNQYLGIGEI